MHFGELGRHSDLLHRGERHGVKLFLNGFHVGGRRDTRGHRAIMHIDRAMEIEDSDRVSNFTVKDAGRDDHTAALGYAEEAAKHASVPVWAGQAALEFRCAAGDWSGALDRL